MNIQQLISKYPKLKEAINGYTDHPDLSEEVAEVKGLTIPGQTDFIFISTMWADCVGSSRSNICEALNCTEVDINEIDQDTNMSATSHLFKRDTEGEAVVLVHGQNGENDGSWLLYTF